MNLKRLRIYIRNFKFSLFGCEEYTLERMIDETYEIYTKEQEIKYGALGIKIKFI